MIELSAHDKVVMKRYFQAAKQWDVLRREMRRREPNDPAKNRMAYNHLYWRMKSVHPTLPPDSPQDDQAETKLAFVLSGRRPDSPSGRGS